MLVHATCLMIALVLLANVVLILGWVEDLAARKRLRFLPWPEPVPPTRTDPAVDRAGSTPSLTAPVPPYRVTQPAGGVPVRRDHVRH